MTASASATRRCSRDGASSSDDHGPRGARGQEAAAGELPGRPKGNKYVGPAGTLRPLRLLRGDLSNLRRRWLSDWAIFNQQVVASAVYIFFTNLLPGITFASDLYVLTGKSWGTIEVVFSTGLCGVMFALFSAQPLTILGVTGPFSVLAENIYALCDTHFHVEFLPVMAWSLIHAGWMHVLLAVFNAHDWTMQYVTHFSADVFSLLNSVIYFHKAALELQRTHDRALLAAFLYAVIGAAGTCLLAVLLSTANLWAPLFHRYVRLGLAEYAAAISIILWIGLPHIGELATLDHDRLQVQTAFRPSSPERATFFVRFWTLPIGWVFLSIIPGAIITVLFYFDHEISSIICTVQRYGVRKPGGFAWDIVLLGATTVLCGILGIPPANGLLPQAPLHAESLLHYVVESPPQTDETGVGAGERSEFEPEPEPARPVARTYEQRYSPLLQAALILVFVSPPLQRLLGLAQTSVLAGLFMFMGYQSLAVNPILARVAHLLTPRPELLALPDGASWLGVHCYTITQVVLTGVVFGITLTVAAPAFPLVIIALVPLRLSLMSRLWSRETLRAVDGWACRPGRPEDGEDEVQPQQTRMVVSDEEKGRCGLGCCRSV
ncbi:putative transporter [Tolypocladium ophioglossoides CBS 100239]|uniref:Putative transporter n=1 Tax=Tolypocladium ophioglossoides (strain CBS 100239) TaxID=1163406 RepID=A0A0L0N6M4_TOLOC|nr:putative transporter [Tolypocladium ophioglossoides CBS 100239]